MFYINPKTLKSIIHLILFLNIPFISFSQGHFIGLFGKSHFQTNQVNPRKMDFVNKSISIIYNRNYCSFSVENSGIKYFPIRNYSTTINDSGILTSFVSMETNTTPDGYYGIIIQENSKGISFQVNMNNFTYYVDKVEKYSEDGKVNGRISFKNFQELINQTKINDSLSSKQEIDRIKYLKKKELEDSISNVEYIKSKNLKFEEKLKEGNNYNPINLKWLNDTIQSKINIKEDELFYNSYRVTIDENGIIIKLEPDKSGSSGNIIEKYVPLINEVVLGRKVNPYVNPQNSKNYPSYSIFYITIHYDPNKKKVKRK